MKYLLRPVSIVTVLLVLSVGVTSCNKAPGAAADEIVGAWRGPVQFTTGAFAAVKDLEFMYVFNAGGTMTESSNYDSAPPVPPAYGSWKKVGDHQYVARYAYYWTKAPGDLAEITKGGGWSPGGHGVLTQKITLADDHDFFDATITFEMFDQQGKPTEPASEATAKGARIKF